jgi:hypothetical protein
LGGKFIAHSDSHMSEIHKETPEERKQRIKERNARYNQKEERKEYRRQASLLHSHNKSLVAIANRIKEYSLDDLIRVVCICCQDRPTELVENYDDIIRVLKILRGSEIVPAVE